MAEKFRADWIKPVNENVLWICQLPRSGGTLLLRLFDSHPQIHCYPAVFGFANKGRIWPEKNEFVQSKDIINDIFLYMNMEKFHLKGLKKQSSNMAQELYPVYFSKRWYHDIFKLSLKGESRRDYCDAFFTALFNAWRNNQNLYGEKKYIVGQMTLHHPNLYRKNYDNFKEVYPNGKMIFIARQPDDWLASAINLRVSTPFSEDPYDIMDYYKTILRHAVQMADENRLIVFKFEDLVLKPEEVMGTLSGQLGIQWNESLLNPTFNGAPFYQNSSFDVQRKSSIDPKVIGKGRQLSKDMLQAIDKEVEELYHQILRHSV